MSEGSDDTKWGIPCARSLPSIDRWGTRYFDINDANAWSPKLQETGATVDLTDVIEKPRPG